MRTYLLLVSVLATSSTAALAGSLDDQAAVQGTASQQAVQEEKVDKRSKVAPGKVAPATSTTATTPAATAAPAAAAIPAANVRQLVRSGDYQSARVALDEYKRASDTPSKSASVSLAYATEILRASRFSKGQDPALQKEAEKELQSVVSTGEPKEQLIARNNLAVIQLQSGDKTGAVRVLEEGYQTAKKSPDAAVSSQYLFNYGQTLERAGGGRDPKELYREAFAADPRMREAADAGMALSLREGKVGDAATFASLLVDKGHYALAEERLRAALADAKVRKSPDAVALLTALMELVGLQAVTPRDFAGQWREFLIGLDGLDSPGTAIRRTILYGYENSAKYPEGYHVREVPAALGIQGLDKTATEQVSDYFTRVAKVRYQERDLRGTLALYSLAFVLRPQNIDAGIGKATLLLDWAAELDPDGVQINDYVNELFDVKGGAYRLGQDWFGIQRFHTVLGTIFTRQKRWGNEYDAHSAIFQLQHAISVRENLKLEQRLPIPKIYRMLGECYSAKQQWANAYAAYLGAARESLEAKDPKQAMEYLDQRLKEVPQYQPTAEEKGKVAEYQSAAAAQLSGGA